MFILVALFLWAVSPQNWTCDQLTRSMPTVDVDARVRAPESEGAEREKAK